MPPTVQPGERAEAWKTSIKITGPYEEPCARINQVWFPHDGMAGDQPGRVNLNFRWRDADWEGGFPPSQSASRNLHLSSALLFDDLEGLLARQRLVRHLVRHDHREVVLPVLQVLERDHPPQSDLLAVETAQAVLAVFLKARHLLVVL